MDERTGIVVAVVVVPLLVFAVGIGLGLRVRAKLSAGTGMDAWRRTSRGLSRRDRWAVSRANARGRATAPALAPFAVQRGEAVSAGLERMVRRGSGFRMLWIALAVLALLNAGLQVLNIATGDDTPFTWFNLTLQCLGAILWCSFPALHRRQLRHMQRSVEQSRKLLDGPPARETDARSAG